MLSSRETGSTNKAHELYLAQRAAMDTGAIAANPNRYTPAEVSTLEFYYSEVARIGADAVATEYDNDPPADETMQRLVLTAYHIQNNCLDAPKPPRVCWQPFVGMFAPVFLANCTGFGN